jgi:hypothetical protein
MEWLGIMVFVGLVVIALIFGWKLLKYALRGTVKIFRTATESGFLGIMVLIIGLAVAFPIMLVLAVIVGWKTDKILPVTSYDTLLGPSPYLKKKYSWQQIDKYDQRVLINDDTSESTELPCGGTFVLTSNEWSIVEAEHGSKVPFYWPESEDEHSISLTCRYYFLIDETVSTKETPVFIQIIHQPRTDPRLKILRLIKPNFNPFTLNRVEKVSRSIVKSAWRKQFVRLRAEINFCDWYGNFGAAERPVTARYIVLSGSPSKTMPDRMIYMNTPSSFYILSTNHFPNLSNNQKKRLEDSMEEVGKTLRYKDVSSASFS